jgi:hypothetical protein
LLDGKAGRVEFYLAGRCNRVADDVEPFFDDESKQAAYKQLADVEYFVSALAVPTELTG